MLSVSCGSRRHWHVHLFIVFLSAAASWETYYCELVFKKSNTMLSMPNCCNSLLILYTVEIVLWIDLNVECAFPYWLSRPWSVIEIIVSSSHITQYHQHHKHGNSATAGTHSYSRQLISSLSRCWNILRIWLNFPGNRSSFKNMAAIFGNEGGKWPLRQSPICQGCHVYKPWRANDLLQTKWWLTYSSFWEYKVV